MKNFLLAFIALSTFTACSNSTKEKEWSQANLVPVNTAGYVVSNASTDVAKPVFREEFDVPVARKSKSLKRKSVASANQEETVPVVNQQPSVETGKTGQSAPVPEVKTQETGQATSPGTAPDEGKAGTSENGTATTGTEKPAKKKGWSDAAKGAAIGGAAGAIGGAIINGRNRTVGAVVGAVIGAAGGYAIGRKRDKNREANEFNLASIY